MDMLNLAFWVFVAVIAGIYAIMALGLYVQFSLAGLPNFGHVAFMAVAAYTMAILVIDLSAPLWVAAVAGRGAFYYVTIASILAVLALSANTGFADFPRLCRLLGEAGYLPRVFASRGRRLVYSYGIWALTVLSADGAGTP